jgi:hypothetical protein
MTIDDATATAPAYQSIIGLLLALLGLLVAAWIFREVTGQRDSRSVPAMLARTLLACWRVSVACWRWSLSLSVAFWLAVAEIFSALAGLPAHPRPRS